MKELLLYTKVRDFIFFILSNQPSDDEIEKCVQLEAAWILINLLYGDDDEVMGVIKGNDKDD